MPIETAAFMLFIFALSKFQMPEPPGIHNIHVDLSTEDGKRWFYATIRDFFSLIPPRMWAMYDGKPIIFLYSAAFAAKQDPLRQNFSKDFACEPYIVKERSWQGKADVFTHGVARLRQNY